MGFIDGDSRQLTLLIYDVQTLSEMVKFAILWRNVQQSGFGVAAFQIIENCILDYYRGCAIDCCHSNPGTLHGGKLIVHQCKKRRDDDGDTVVYDGRQLKTQALSKARGRLKKDVLTLNGGDDDISLNWPAYTSAQPCEMEEDPKGGTNLNASLLNTFRRVKSISTVWPSFLFVGGIALKQTAVRWMLL